MRKITSILSVLAVTWTTCLWSNAVLAATPNEPDQARIDELQHQIDALDQELNQLRSANDPAAQQRGMQRHWSMMQDHMGSVRTVPGMQPQGCRDWMMMDPSTMGPGMMEQGMMGKGMMGCPMMGHGMGWMWAPNAAVSLPDRESHGAKLVATICSQCHSSPSPALHTKSEWAGVTARMRQHMQAQTGAAGGGVRIPSPDELDVLTQYLAEHAADAQSPP